MGYYYFNNGRLFSSELETYKRIKAPRNKINKVICSWNNNVIREKRLNGEENYQWWNNNGRQHRDIKEEINKRNIK